jgi:hypothetical protein
MQYLSSLLRIGKVLSSSHLSHPFLFLLVPALSPGPDFHLMQESLSVFLTLPSLQPPLSSSFLLLPPSSVYSHVSVLFLVNVLYNLGLSFPWNVTSYTKN